MSWFLHFNLISNNIWQPRSLNTLSNMRGYRKKYRNVSPIFHYVSPIFSAPVLSKCSKMNLSARGLRFKVLNLGTKDPEFDLAWNLRWWKSLIRSSLELIIWKQWIPFVLNILIKKSAKWSSLKRPAFV